MQNPYLAAYAAERQHRPTGASGGSRARAVGRGTEEVYRTIGASGGSRARAAGRGTEEVYRTIGASGRETAAGRHRAAERARRKRLARRRRLAAGIFLLGAIAAGVWFFLGRNRSAAAAESRVSERKAQEYRQEQAVFDDGGQVQGLPREDFDRHPEWTEDFLTPNEYSRPGDALEEVKSIFVHYTANPGTSAAQNRSYFEQQKDMHQASVSAHFIIGYEGEILQCLPLDEIGYAVQTRNFDSISIECCYKAKDGSFTQETYDSLVSLLAWLTDVYDLDTEDILRHYDCGGKKCPLYYTENPDSWERLKRDVEKIKL